MQTTEMTRKVVEHHIQSLTALDVDEILRDYTEESVLFTPDGPVRGLAELKKVFEGFLQTMPEGLIDNLKFLRRDFVDDVAYLLWMSGESAPLGTDTFVIKNGKISIQTFAAYLV